MKAWGGRGGTPLSALCSAHIVLAAKNRYDKNKLNFVQGVNSVQSITQKGQMCYNCFQERGSAEGPRPHCGFDLAEDEEK